jgi:hypothetical protein
MSTLLTSHDTLKDVVARLIDVMNTLVWPLVGLAIVFFFYGLIRYIYNAGNSKGHTLGRDVIIWSLVGLFVIFSLWGLVNVISITLLGVTPNGVGSNGAFYAPRPGYAPGSSFKDNSAYQEQGQYQQHPAFQDTSGN